MKENILSMFLDELELSVRSINCLKRSGINTVEELCCLTPSELLKVRKINKENYDEILKKLAELNLSLKSENNYSDKSLRRNDFETTENYLSINICDSSGEMRYISEGNYYSFFKALLGRDHFLTYKPVVEHPKMYFRKLISKIVSNLSEQEQEMIRDRFGLENNRRRSYRDIAKNNNLSESKTREIISEAINTLRRPSMTKDLRDLFYNEIYNNESNDAQKINSIILSGIIKNELDYYLQKDIAYEEDYFASEVFKSPRFKHKSEHCFSTSIKKLDLSVRTYNCLRRAEIDTVEELLELSDAEIMNIKNIGRCGFQEVKTVISKFMPVQYMDISYKDVPLEELGLTDSCIQILFQNGINSIDKLLMLDEENLRKIQNLDDQSKDILLQIIFSYKEGKPITRMKKYPLDTEHLFFNREEVPITRTCLPIKKMIHLINKGIFFVSDYTEFYYMFNRNYVESQPERLYFDLFSDRETLKTILYYSEPILIVDVSNILKKLLSDKQVHSFKQVVDLSRDLPNVLREEIDTLGDMISNAKERIAIKKEDYYDVKIW